MGDCMQTNRMVNYAATGSEGLSSFHLATSSVVGLADVLAVEDCSTKHAGHVQTVTEGWIGTEGNVQVAFEIDVGCECAQPFQFDGATIPK